jgi:hypothetical protein
VTVLRLLIELVELVMVTALFVSLVYTSTRSS